MVHGVEDVLMHYMDLHADLVTQSVKTVLREAARGSLRGVHGPVSKLISVPGEYALAVETALGAAMQNVVVENEQDAKNAIRLLKQRDAGRATFLPLTTIRGSEIDDPGLGYLFQDVQE